MEFHGIIMRGPLNTDNIRAQDGTLAATVADSTGDINFQRDIEARDIDARRNLTVFNNFEVQGPLSTFIQSITVGVNAAIGRDLSVTRDVAMGRNATISRQLTVGADYDLEGGVITKYLQVQGPPISIIPDYHPAPGKVLGTNDTAGNVWWLYPSIPVDQIILFYTNDQVIGYELQTLLGDDDVVYITKGSAAGGETGGGVKVGGTWTHRHGLGSITIPPHNHQWYNGDRQSWQSNGLTLIRVDNTLTGNTTRGLFGEVTSANGKSCTTLLYTKNSTAVTGSAGNTDYNATWRPKGKNFTMQKRIVPS